MSILFREVYERAFPLFDDPKITIAYNTNRIQYEKLMYGFLKSAITSFNNPVAIGIRLMNRTEPSGTMEVISSDGVHNSYVLDSSFIIKENSIYYYTAAGEPVVGSLNVNTRTVTFPDVIPYGAEYSIEQYYCGEFVDNFSGLSKISSIGDSYIAESVKDILARLIVMTWAEGEKNNVLDIRNAMSQTDFKNSPNDKILKSKIQLVEQLKADVANKQNMLSWATAFVGNSANLGRL